MNLKDYSTELYHWGVKGQKWGVRRYQNKDGSLTPAGKKRAAKNEQLRKSEADRYKRMAESEERSFERERKFMKEFKAQGQYGPHMRRMYGFNDEKEAQEMFGKSLQQLWKEELDAVNHDMNITRARVTAYTKAHDTLMKMDVSTVKKQDITKLGRKAVNDSFNSDPDEDVNYYDDL